MMHANKRYEVYIDNLVGSGQAHSTFYTNSACKNAYKNYVKTFVGRYVNEPTIMAWELTNEARCNGCASKYPFRRFPIRN